MKLKLHHKIISGVIAVGIGATLYLTKLDVGVKGAINTDIVQANINQTICNPNWSTKSIRPPVSYTNPLKAKLCEKQKCGDASKYELDHAIALTDGGHPTSLDNLWLQPYDYIRDKQLAGAHQKDKYEIYVHKQICSGEITLAEGQRRLLHWWIYYKQMNQKLSGTDAEEDKDDE